MHAPDRRDVLKGLTAVTTATATAAAPLRAYTNERVSGPGYAAYGARWLMENFGASLNAAADGTPFSVALICAIAYQESGYFWWRRAFRQGKTPAEVLRLIVLDDVEPRARAFPRTSSVFTADPRFASIAPALIAVSDAARAEQGVSATGKVRFGYGLFQNDLQNILTGPGFFTDPAPAGPNGAIGRWGDIGACAGQAIAELNRKYAAVGRDVYRAVKAYNGSNSSADIYLHNVQVYERAIARAAW